MAVYRRGYQRYQGPITSRWTRFLVLPRFAWRRLFQQRLIALLMRSRPDMAFAVRHLHLYQQSCGSAERDGQAIPELHRGQRKFLHCLHAGPGNLCRHPRRACRTRADRARSRKQCPAPLFQPAVVPRGLRTRPAYDAFRHAFSDYLGPGTVAIRHAGRYGRRVVVQRKLADRASALSQDLQSGSCW